MIDYARWMLSKDFSLDTCRHAEIAVGAVVDVCLPERMMVEKGMRT